MPQADLSREIANRWRNEPDETKALYLRHASYAKQNHERLYPDYKYRPRRKEKSNRSKNNDKETSVGKRTVRNVRKKSKTTNEPDKDINTKDLTTYKKLELPSLLNDDKQLPQLTSNLNKQSTTSSVLFSNGLSQPQSFLNYYQPQSSNSSNSSSNSSTSSIDNSFASVNLNLNQNNVNKYEDINQQLFSNFSYNSNLIYDQNLVETLASSWANSNFENFYDNISSPFKYDVNSDYGNSNDYDYNYDYDNSLSSYNLPSTSSSNASNSSYDHDFDIDSISDVDIDLNLNFDNYINTSHYQSQQSQFQQSQPQQMAINSVNNVNNVNNVNENEQFLKYSTSASF